MGRLFQGLVTGKNGLGKIVEGTDTFYVMKFEDIPKDRLNGVCYTSGVCEVRPGKKHKYYTNHNLWHQCLLHTGRRNQHSLTRTLQYHD